MPVLVAALSCLQSRPTAEREDMTSGMDSVLRVTEVCHVGGLERACRRKDCSNSCAPLKLLFP